MIGRGIVDTVSFPKNIATTSVRAFPHKLAQRNIIIFTREANTCACIYEYGIIIRYYTTTRIRHPFQGSALNRVNKKCAFFFF